MDGKDPCIACGDTEQPAQSTTTVLRRRLFRALGALAALGASLALLGRSESVGAQRPPVPRQVIRRPADEPRFQNKKGTYKAPDLIITGNRVSHGRIPASLECNVPFVIYSSWAAWVRDCKGHGGPNDGDNDVCKEADDYAKDVWSGIKCPDNCRSRLVKKIWTGWSCDPIDGRFWAVCAVEVEVICVPERD
jgi:hypothetical protein